MKRTSWILITIFILGLIILILPDKGDPVFRFNKTHGPSLLDLVGLALMLGSWLISCIIVVRKWELVAKRSGKGNIYLLISLYCLFLAGIITALLLSVEWMLWACVAAASMINITLIILAFHVEKQDRL